MQNSFIRETLTDLYRLFGNELADIDVLLPSKRARLFFNDELSSLLQDTPIWQPRFLSIDTLMQEASGIRLGDRLRLITELYKVYSRFHNETFDQFYLWGEVLLADFDMIDNYMVDAKKMFININDLKEIDQAFDFLSEDQALIVKRFWSSFSGGVNSSDQQKKFLSIWNTLFDIYSLYRQRLEVCGFGYKGFIYRKGAEYLVNTPTNKLTKQQKTYAIIGFNALSLTEKKLFSYLKQHHRTLFFWDTDEYYLGEKKQEAGLFLRENIRLFGNDASVKKQNNYLQKKEISIIEAPSDTMQCKYVWEFLQTTQQRMLAQGRVIGKESVVVLTDENLLLPVLYSIPPAIEAFNVTSGYCLKQTAAYNLVEYLLQLQRNRSTDISSETLFYYKDIRGVLSHPYIVSMSDLSQKKAIEEILEHIDTAQQPFVKRQLLCKTPFLNIIFAVCTDYRELSDYLIGILDAILIYKREQGHPGNEQHFLYKTLSILMNSATIVAECNVEMSIATYVSFLRKFLQKSTLPFEGDPLIGIQVMGILETRNLDFENVLILSMEEDHFPGIAKERSYIPANLRAGYGLPTPAYQEAMYSYYFYRLLQRAKNIEIVYCSKSDELSTGEPSRFVHQLLLESPHAIVNKTISIQLNTTAEKNIEAEKNDRVMAVLSNYINGKRTLSPSALFRYIQCPYSFYLRYIEGVKEPVVISDEIDVSTFGSLMHECLEDIYRDVIDKTNLQEHLRHYLDNRPQIEALIDKKIATRIESTDITTNGLILSSRYFIVNYIVAVLQHDLKQEAFKVSAVEFPLRASLVVRYKGEPKTIRFYGIIDRVDTLSDGTVRLVDYKSGSAHKSVSSLEALFQVEGNQRPKIAMFQIALYSLLYGQQYNKTTIPALYFAKEMNTNNYDSLLAIGKQKINSFSGAVARDFEDLLVQKIEELLDNRIPFIASCNENVCKYCPYLSLCGGR